ncbi:MAG: uncharacterized protein KVP18_001856 [Porospora cf. gigantea A]|uniref:uncharacterized protein n=2 Tax=Porospora cf. gigantea A TaxID=2853593 RepID=UPI003559D6C4|nr:MAG: hypothetical protein KVP18_001856 [Porospora cf. gigantea A]
MLGQLMPQPTNLKTELAANFDFTEGGTIDRDSIQVEIERKEKGEITNMNVPDVRGGYDGTTSFFDDISCDALERQRRNEVRFDRETLRELDTETFGQATANRHRMDYMRYRRGGFNRGCRKLFMQSLGINSR